MLVATTPWPTPHPTYAVTYAYSYLGEALLWNGVPMKVWRDQAVAYVLAHGTYDLSTTEGHYAFGNAVIKQMQAQGVPLGYAAGIEAAANYTF